MRLVRRLNLVNRTSLTKFSLIIKCKPQAGRKPSMSKIIKKSYGLIFILAILLAFTLNVVSVIAAPTKGSLTIRKFDVNRYENLKESTGQASDEANLPSQAIKMADVEFKVAKLLVVAGATNVTPETPVDPTFTARIKQTDSEGVAIFDELELGYYLVTETIPAEYTSPEDGQFIIAIPIVTEDSNGTKTANYDVVVFPKNQKNPDDAGIGPIAPDDHGIGPGDNGIIPTPPIGNDIIMTPTPPSNPTSSVTPSASVTSSGGQSGVGNASQTAGYAMSAKTGDFNSIAGLIMLMIASSGMIMSIIKRRKGAT